MRSRWLLSGALVLALSACMMTQDVSLGTDRPPLHEEPDADVPIDVVGSDAAAIGKDDAAPSNDASPGRPTVAVEAGQVSSRDAGPVSKPDADAAVVATCTLNGHRPFDGLAPTSLPVSPLPRPDEWDGGRPSLLDNDPLTPPGLPRDYEAGIPPFCCTLMTPWFCAKP